MNIYRHGDVLLKEIKSLPQNLTKLSHGILAEGETTGHKHQLITKTKNAFQLYRNEKGVMFLEVFTETPLVHEEHKTISIAPSIYEIGIEREYDPFEKLMNSVKD